MVTLEDYERYSLALHRHGRADQKLVARLTSRADEGDEEEDENDEPPPKKAVSAQKKKKKAQKKKAKAQKKRQEEARLAREQAWQAQQQEHREQAGGGGLLSAVEQTEYLDLLSRYQNRGVFTPTAGEQVEVLRLAELQLRVAAHQREFAQRWPRVPGLRPEGLAEGVVSWSQAQLARVLRECPEGAWVPHERQNVALLPDTPVQPGLLGHVLRKAGVLVRPKPGCVLLPPGAKSSSTPGPVDPSGVARGEEGEWREGRRPDGESLLASHGADLLVDLDTLLLDWHGRPWLLPCRITEGGRVWLGSALPSGIHREANRRFCNWLLEHWVQGQQLQEGEGASVSPTGHHGGTDKEEKGGTSPASFKAPQEDDPMEPNDGLVDMDCLSISSSPRSADLVIDEEGGSSSPPRSGGFVVGEEEKKGDKASVKEDTVTQTQDGDRAWSVDLWELAPGGKRLLLQHQAWKCGIDPGSMLCTVVCKPEYQSPLGAEQWSGLECAEHAARLLLFPALLRVRVDVPSNEVLLVEQVERQPCDDERDRLSALFAPVAALLEQLAGEGGLDLRTELTRLFHPTVSSGKRGGKGAPPPLPLDPQVIFPHHFRSGRIPLSLWPE
ncbi:uncharacterized protein LOC144175871 isoform X2 [Haemaphysalis longicornis]